MIISRTPFRISFAGGGTDLPEFYRKEGGEVVSTAINKYMYVTVNKRFDDTIRVSYTRTEIVDSVDKLEHELIREAMKMTGVRRGVEITTVADIPARGTGLGSSSSLTVGMLNALYAYRGLRVSFKRLAEEACRIEIDIVGEPIGKQDQYIAAYGGLKHFYFKPDNKVLVEPLLASPNCLRALQENLAMFYTNITRSASSVLDEQKLNSAHKFEELRGLKKLAGQVKSCIEKGEKKLDEFGLLLDESWQLKKKMARNISNDIIDDYYRRAREAGALGGKVLGAGGGGFLLLYCPKNKQKRLRQALRELTHFPVEFEPDGSRIIFAES